MENCWTAFTPFWFSAGILFYWHFSDGKFEVKNQSGKQQNYSIIKDWFILLLLFCSACVIWQKIVEAEKMIIQLENIDVEKLS